MNLNFTKTEKRLSVATGLTLLGTVAMAGPLASVASSIDMSDVLTGIGAIGVAIFAVIVAIRGLKYLKSAV